MNSIKVVVIIVAVLSCVVFAMNNNEIKCEKNTPHLAPCTRTDGSPGECRNNGNCVNIHCTKFCKVPLPSPCDPNPCGATASCNVLASGSFTCTCENGDVLEGEPCEDDI